MKAAFLSLALFAFFFVAVFAQQGNSPLTNMAVPKARMAFQDSRILSGFTGLTTDVDGISYATIENGLFRFTPNVTNDPSKLVSVRNFVFGNPNDNEFRPCSTTGPSTSPYYTCLSGNYLGDSNTIWYEDTVRGNSFKLPFVIGDDVFMIGVAVVAGVETPSIFPFHKASLSFNLARHNRIPQTLLQGAYKVVIRSGNVYIGTTFSGNSYVLRAPSGSVSDFATNPFVVGFTNATTSDFTFDSTGNNILFTGTMTTGATTTQNVWSVEVISAFAPLGTSTPLLPGAVTSKTTVTTDCVNLRTITYDVDATRGNRVYVSCSGSATVAPLVQSFSFVSPSTWTAQTTIKYFVGENGWSKSLHDPESGVIYFGGLGVPEVTGYSTIFQFSSKGGPSAAPEFREGRVDLPRQVVIAGMAWAGLGSSDSTAQDFYVAGEDTVTRSAVWQRFSAAETCLNDCNGHGTCSGRVCTCDSFTNDAGGTQLWEQPWCATMPCVDNCNGHGTCFNRTCACFPVWRTEDLAQPCMVKQCPSNCSFPRGECVYNASAPLEPLYCNCIEPGWGGEACASKAKFPCFLLTDNCTACVDNPSCGWCASSRTCYEGTRDGPLRGLDQECRSWFYGKCPAVGISIVNYILTAMFGIILLIGLISGLLIDTASDDPERRTEWYMFQRAGKVWSMIYQLQLVAVAGLIKYTMPTSFTAFTRYWNWILLAWGFPWHRRPQSIDGWADSSATTGRDLSSLPQMITYWKVTDSEIFWAWLIWLGGLIALSVILYLIVVLVAIIRGGRAGFIASTRPSWIGLRILEMGHLGVCILGPISMVKGGGSAIAGGIFWVVFGLGVPIGLFVWLGFIKDKKGLFAPKFAASCYPYYGAFDFRYRTFIVAPWVRRILIGIFVGFIVTSSAVAQLVLISIVNAAWLVFVILFRKMYSDYLQRYLEIILAFINLVAFLLLFGFSSASGSTTSGVAIAFIVLQFIGVTISCAFFIISWLQMNQVYSLAQCFKFCTCRGGGDGA